MVDKPLHICHGVRGCRLEVNSLLYVSEIRQGLQARGQFTPLCISNRIRGFKLVVDSSLYVSAIG